ncbi:hypothetical protein FisN_26Hh099 [Fistulifera solaris]|jgi:hypothetical protein|uniref:Uncharacterized protein n=1 Tax=Fistulifera solaris TaxID=1519565 RepID=A0A1Z5JY18_FISSO|nr:hypothetical protein FisN_26Hh099 [Fistulifera solaris]|eukprot:GAX18799.1 hypothetical protein FisN_26Hh099 [Fistulifera solaris]
MQLSAALMSLLGYSGEPATTPIAIGLQCGNVRMDKLSDHAKQVMAQALVDSYKTSYALHDNNDSFLAGVHFDQSHATKESLKWNGTWNYGCRLCPNDDDSTMSAPFAAFVADLGCTACAPTSVVGVSAWEATLTSILRATNHAELKKANACQISLHDRLEEDETVEHVEIGVKCDNADFASLGAKASGFSSRALEDSYNKVHELLKGGDSFLAGVHFDGAHSPKKAALKWNGTWNYGCRLCPNDDDTLGDASAVGGYVGELGCALCAPDNSNLRGDDTVVRAWEAEYTAALLESQYAEFNNVKNCKIDIVAQYSDAAAKA